MGNLAIKAYHVKNPAVDPDNFWGGTGRYMGRKELKWDGANMKITNFEAANQWVKRDYRGSWEFGSI